VTKLNSSIVKTDFALTKFNKIPVLKNYDKFSQYFSRRKIIFKWTEEATIKIHSAVLKYPVCISNALPIENKLVKNRLVCTLSDYVHVHTSIENDIKDHFRVLAAPLESRLTAIIPVSILAWARLNARGQDSTRSITNKSLSISRQPRLYKPPLAHILPSADRTSRFLKKRQGAFARLHPFARSDRHRLVRSKVATRAPTTLGVHYISTW